ncbi:SorT family sulfite dehydrogenase catalytic subunit [Marinobacter zhejiangensis]|uniref:Sulfoxide reductase catalytic subunit YedY n=1 Tax=Marinobacter zhejiangensis TaxID=488535 RepID=A0A1I4SEJ5_9GAMM|nr:sulfite oxidase [Marinobacter zhejiangensis]SFM62794.1 sulfoxide reductase catalytic subunit YedY [Marinobacter zhejiangensis]
MRAKEPTTTLDLAQNPPMVSRRRLLVGSAGALASVSLLGFSPLARSQTPATLPDYAAWKSLSDLIVHSANTMETRRDAIGSGVLTPSDKLFVRNNLPSPGEAIATDRDAWTVNIEGVKNPRALTIAELKTMGVETVAAVLQCSGNGRAFFPHGASGTQWSVGAAGCVLWTGVPLRTVVDALGGVADGMNYITSTGGEELPEGIDPKTIRVERSVPVAALDRAILAWELNDDPLPVTHGGPLRMVVPGYYGVNNVKYVRHIAFTPNQTDTKIQVSGYRLRDIGVKGASDQPSMWEMNVKSWVTSPLEQTPQGRHMIYGVAFGGSRAVASVEVSLDGGGNWQQARFLGPDLGPFAWRPFVLAANLAPGDYRVVSRATDSDGNSQPENRTENERGYGHNGWKDHGVTLKVT